MSQLCDLIGVAVILKNNQYLKFESGLDNEYQAELSRYTTLFKNASDIETVIEGIKYGFVGRGKKDPQEFWKYFKGLGDTEGFKSFSNDLIKIGIDQISQIVLWADEDKQSWRAYRWINYDINSGLITVGSAGSLIKGYHAEKSAWSCIRDAFPNIKSAWEDKPKKKPTSKYTYKFWTKFNNNVMALENKNPREDGFYVYDNIIYDYDYKENLNFFHHGENDFTVPASIVGIKAVAAIDKYHDTFFNFPGDVFENFTITTDLQYLDAGDFFFNGINNLKVIDSKTGELLFQTKAFKEASTLLYEREKFKQFCELLPTSDWDAIQALFKRKSSASAKSTKAKIEISEEHRIEIPFPHDYYRNMLRDDGAEEFVIEKDSIYGTVLRIYTGAASHVIIPNGVTHISEKAFSNSKTLKKIEFSNPVSIGEKAFENCINLEEIIIDARISGSKNIFWGCTSVKKVNITNNAGLDYPILHSFYEDLPTIAFNHYKGGYYIGSETNPYRVLVKYNDEKIEEAIIAPDVEMVYTLAFRGCDLFKKVIIPEGMTAIDDSTFRSCKSLKEIVWPSTLVSIEARAFCECDSLETITIPPSVKKIAKDAFSACQKLQSVTISDGAEYIGDLTFANCENLKCVIIPDSVKRIRSNSFENSPNVVIVSNSEYAERYAKKNNIAFQRQAREEARLKKQEEAATKTQMLAEQKAQSEAEKTAEKALCEEIIASIVAKNKESSSRFTNAEIVTIIESNGISIRKFEKYISDKYEKSLKLFFEDLEILKTPRLEFNELIAILKQRYENRPKVSDVTALITENTDIDLSIIANNAKKFTNMTARELLLNEGILTLEEALNHTELFVGVLHMPGNEPENIKRRLSTLFAKLDEAYPDKVIEGLNREHKKWGETVTELYRLLGYANSKNFLMAYGYTVVDNKGGRTANKNEEIIAELKRRYPDGAPFTSVAQLKEANADLAPKIKSLENAAQSMFGTTLKKYLIDQNILASEKQEFGNSEVPTIIDSVTEDVVYDSKIKTAEPSERSNIETTLNQESKPIVVTTTTSEEDFVIYRGILKQYNGKASDIVIPETVTKIGERAFKDNKKLKAVALHDGIVRIDGGAFWGCTSLQSIVIPDGVAKIDWGAFNECSALKEVTIGKGVTNIGERAFRNCKALKNLFVSDTVTYFGVSAFDGCGSLTISGYADSAAEKYANKNGIKFKRIVIEDKPEPQEEPSVPNAEKEREEELRKIREDNERRVREDQERQARIAAEERKKREEEEAIRKAKEAEQRKTLEEAYRKAQEDAARRAALVAERQAREEEERKKREEIERICREAEERRLHEEAERKAQEEAERERKLREEEERKAREEAARKEELRKIQEENERRIREDQERIAREQEAIRKREEEARRAREEAERKAREEAERLEKLKAERRAQKVCQHCGGKFKGLFTKTCSSCGRKKDY